MNFNPFNKSNKPKPTPDAVPVGNRYDGTPLRMPWPFLPHTLVSGVTGSGKSSWTASLIGSVADHPNTAICGIDMKGGVELGGWKPRLTTLASTPKDATQLLSDIQQLVNYRATVLEHFGKRRWDFDLGPAVLLVVDELAELAAIDSASIAAALLDPETAHKAIKEAKNESLIRIQVLASICRLARFVAISVVCATQYPLANIVPSELRSNLVCRISGRVTGNEQINVALGSGMSDQISADDIAIDEPGVAYVLGLPDCLQPVRSRAYYPTDQQINQRAEQTRHLQIPTETLFNNPNTQPNAA